MSADNHHISKNKFYTVLQKRLQEYEEAIFGNRMTQGMKLQMMQASSYSIDKIKAIDSQINLFGLGFWGYGINSISDGKETYSHLDVEDIKTGGLNKHHEDYRVLLLLIFKIENAALYFNFFSIDTCTVKLNSNINTKYELKDFDIAAMRFRGTNIFIDLFFKGAEKPVSFQIETYIVGGNLNGMELAKYYIDSITKIANEIKIKNKRISETESDISAINKKIDKIESQLRIHIADTLFKETGKEDFESLLTGDPKKDIRARIKNYLDINPNKVKDDFKSLKKASQFLDIDHLKKIIIKEEYWTYFSLKFKDQEKVEKYFKQFSEIRHAVKHSREITELLLLEGKAAMIWLEMVLN